MFADQRGSQSLSSTTQIGLSLRESVAFGIRTHATEAISVCFALGLFRKNGSQ